MYQVEFFSAEDRYLRATTEASCMAFAVSLAIKIADESLPEVKFILVTRLSAYGDTTADRHMVTL